MTTESLESRVMQLEQLVSRLNNANTYGDLRYGQPDISPALNTDLSTEVAARTASMVPLGAILIWSGAIVDIPTNWQLCDGTNGTPNLRDKFIVGAGTTYAVGGTGGSASFTHTGGGLHQHDTKDLSHAHVLNFAPSVGGGAVNAVVTPSATTTLTHPLHSTDGNHTHDGHPLPPYYALAYIQRIS